jgi:hypothetical protein
VVVQKKGVHYLIVATLLFVLIIFSGGSVFAQAASNSISYNVVIRPGEIGQVEARFNATESLPAVVVFTVEEIEGINVDFNGNVFNIYAEGPAGQSLTVYEETDGWYIHTAGFDELTLYYSFGDFLVEDGGMERNFIRIMDSEGLFVNQAVFAMPDINVDEIFVEYDLPADWQAVTHFTPLGDNIFQVEGVPDWHTDFLASVTRLGVVKHEVSKQIAGMDYTFYVLDSAYESRGLYEFWRPVYGTTPEEEMEAYIDLTSASVEYLKDIFGFWPGGKRYTITTKVTDHDELHSIVGFKYWMQAWTRERLPDVPHHVAHAWIWRAPLNLNAPEHDLLMEGMPTYYQADLMAELTGESRWRGLHYFHHLVLQRAAQYDLLDKWTVKVYAQNHMRILALDKYIKNETENSKNINDLMAYLGTEFGLQGELISREDLKTAIAAVSGATSDEVDDWYESYLAGGVGAELPPVDGFIDDYRESFFEWLDSYDTYPEEEARGNRTMILISTEIGLHANGGFGNEHSIASRAGLFNLDQFREEISVRAPISEQDVIDVLAGITGVDQSDFFSFYEVGSFRPTVADVELWLADYDFHLWLDQGWNLVSAPRWVEKIGINSDHILAMLTYLEGTWVSGNVGEQLKNPAQAVFIKVAQPTVIRFRWEEYSPQFEFADQLLKPGWNLIGSGIRESYNTILANISYNGFSGVTQIYAPNAFNGRKDHDYYLPWSGQLKSLVAQDQQAQEEMYPFDGYWINLNGSDRYYSTPVSTSPVEPVRLTPVYKIEADPAKGFNYPYYLFIPMTVHENPYPHLMVGPNNTGYQDDDPQVHDSEAYTTAANSWKTHIAYHVGTPMLVPTFPRPRDDYFGYNWRHYTHSLNRATMLIDDGGMLDRIDLQLVAMIEDANERLADQDIYVDQKVLMNGFSACGTFTNRFAMLHPHLVKAVATGGINAIPTFPAEVVDEYTLRYPVGLADIEQITGIVFDKTEYLKIAQFIYMGSEDDNDTTLYDDAYEREDAQLIWDLVGEDMSERWMNSIQLYEELGIYNAQFVTYDGVGHTLNGQIINDLIDFFRANSGQ